MKVAVLGFDGASPRLIEKWIYCLPTFRRFKEEGILGLSIPPTPAQTPVAWTTFMTGKNPGKHGIFSFAMRRQGTYERRIISPALIKSKTLWRILSEHGKKVGIINVPMSTPEEIRGFMVPGFVSRHEGIPHPPEVRKKLSDKFGIEKVAGDLETDVIDKVRTDPDNFFNRLNEITDELNEVSLFLLQEEKWDFFMTVFMGTDRIQHFFWKNLDESHTEYMETVFTEKTKQFYKKMDQIIEEFLSVASEDTVTIVLSDHGFCPIKKEILINNYLQEFGLLKAKEGEIELVESKAVSYGYGDVWLNVEGREPKGIIHPGMEYEETRNELIKALENLKVDNEHPIKKIEKREDIYWGPYINEAPDLTIFFNSGWQAARSPQIEAIKREDKRYVVDNPRWSGGHDGTHDPEEVPGILGFLGPNIPCRKSLKAYLWDVAPTILSLLNVPVPNDMDGKSLSTVLSKKG